MGIGRISTDIDLFNRHVCWLILSWASQNSLRMEKLFIAFALLLVSAVATAGMIDAHVISKLHNASRNIEQNTNHRAVVESIYKQIKPRANITNRALASAEIDQIVRSYISDKYAPALIANYAQLYSQLKAAKSDFSACESLNPFNLTNNVLSALCAKTQGATVRVEYQTNGYDRGWSTAAVFIFTNDADTLRLNAIELLLKEGAKAYVEGL